jgi:hypothetical protein
MFTDVSEEYAASPSRSKSEDSDITFLQNVVNMYQTLRHIPEDNNRRYRYVC